MKRQDFENYLNENLEGLSILDRERILVLMEDEWIPYMRQKNCSCYKCGTSKFKFEWSKKGEDVILGNSSDFFGNKYINVRTDEYRVLNRICLRCGFKTEIKRIFVEKLNYYVRKIAVK